MFLILLCFGMCKAQTPTCMTRKDQMPGTSDQIRLQIEKTSSQQGCCNTASRLCATLQLQKKSFITLSLQVGPDDQAKVRAKAEAVLRKKRQVRIKSVKQKTKKMLAM